MADVHDEKVTGEVAETQPAADPSRVGAGPTRSTLSTGRLLFFLGLGIFVLFGFWTLVAVVWAASSGREIAEESKKMQEEAVAAGIAHGASTCLDQGLARVQKCDFWNMKCKAQAQIFTAWCMDSSSDVDAFCHDIPAPFDLVESVPYRTKVCGVHGQHQEQGCDQVVQSVQMYCDKRRANN
jgi:hypothetical protein